MTDWRLPDLRALAWPVILAGGAVACGAMALWLIFAIAMDGGELADNFSQLKTLRAPVATASQVPASVVASSPLVEGPPAKLTTLVSEKFNVLFGPLGVNLQGVTVNQKRDFGRGLVVYSVNLTGNGNADGINRVIGWIATNGDAVVLQRLTVEPAGMPDNRIAHVAMDVLVVAAPRPPS